MKWSSIKRRVGIAAYLSAVAFVVAHTTNAFVANALYVPLEQRHPSPAVTETVVSSESPNHSVDRILQSGLFLLPASPTALSDQSAAPTAPPLETAKKIALFGTVMGLEGGRMAIVEDLATKKQSLYRLGSPVPNVGTLVEIEKNRVLFRDGEQEEWLSFAAAQQSGVGATGYTPPVAKSPAGSQRRIIDRREVNAALEDTTRLLMQAQAVPYLTDGALDGFRLYNVVPLGFFDKIGLQTNDILQRINGVEIRDPGMMLTLFQQLRQERTVRLDLVRSSQRQTLLYEIR
jgi:general secretion pathway protein C